MCLVVKIIESSYIEAIKVEFYLNFSDEIQRRNCAGYVILLLFFF